jgi:hypothetical protein
MLQDLKPPGPLGGLVMGVLGDGLCQCGAGYEMGAAAAPRTADQQSRLF